MSMFVTKTIETLVAEAEGADGLRRVLGRRDLVASAWARSSAPASSC